MRRGVAKEGNNSHHLHPAAPRPIDGRPPSLCRAPARFKPIPSSPRPSGQLGSSVTAARSHAPRPPPVPTAVRFVVRRGGAAGRHDSRREGRFQAEAVCQRHGSFGTVRCHKGHFSSATWSSPLPPAASSRPSLRLDPARLCFGRSAGERKQRGKKAKKLESRNYIEVSHTPPDQPKQSLQTPRTLSLPPSVPPDDSLSPPPFPVVSSTRQENTPRPPSPSLRASVARSFCAAYR